MKKDKLILELESENRYLKEQLELLTQQSHLRDELVMQQSKMASMGEMLGNIAHQWRQPLMEISTHLIDTEVKIKLLGKVSNEDILNTIYKSNHIIKYMSQTIDDFRDFFAKNKQKEDFLITEQVSSVINIVKSSLASKGIKLNIIIKNNTCIYGLKNEYLQVLINIISNAKDAIESRKIKDGKIVVKLYEKDGNSILEILDNGGGIDIDPIDKVFAPFFTYKKKNGTGVGLFMSKLIIENNMDGRLTVENIENGAIFKIIIPLNKGK